MGKNFSFTFYIKCSFYIFSFLLPTGVLGTYNHESYDDWKMPDNKIADSVYKFANAYEITKKRSCVAEQPKEKTPCANVPSPKCKELFNSSSSMFARFFNVIDPKPFMDACVYDTSCKSMGHCSAVAAYRGLLKAVKENPDFCPDCGKLFFLPKRIINCLKRTSLSYDEFLL